MSYAPATRVLLLAPHPFYQDRGTPIAVDLLLRTLSARGCPVDVVTFAEGRDRSYAGVRIHRARPWGRISGIRPGFSLKKVYCDVFLGLRAWRLLRRNRYDVIHAVEESAFFAALFAWRYRLPYIYDMDSLMSAQLADKFPLLARLRGLLQRLEAIPIRRALAVAPMCEDLARHASRLRRDGVVVIKDVSLLSGDPAGQVEDLRAQLGLAGPVVMYIGNLEPYQGLDLLLAAFARARPAALDAQLVIIGGVPEDIARYQAAAQRLGIAERTHFLGPRPVDHIGAFLNQADVLVSPRVHGTNTPMKIYSYLASGVAVLATDLPTHTQVLDHRIARLAAPEATAFGDALSELLEDPQLREGLGRRGAAYARQEHSYSGFVDSVERLYTYVEERLCRAS